MSVRRINRTGVALQQHIDSIKSDFNQNEVNLGDYLEGLFVNWNEVIFFCNSFLVVLNAICLLYPFIFINIKKFLLYLHAI